MFNMCIALKSVKLSIWGLVIFSPLVITTMLHLTKRVYVDLHKTQLSNPESRIKTYTKMSRMIVLVVRTAIVLQLPTKICPECAAINENNNHIRERLFPRRGGCFMFVFLLNSYIYRVLFTRFSVEEI